MLQITLLIIKNVIRPPKAKQEDTIAISRAGGTAHQTVSYTEKKMVVQQRTRFKHDKST